MAAFPRCAEVLAGVLQAFGTMALHGGVPVSQRLCDAGAVELASAAISVHQEVACRVLMWLSYFQQAQVAARVPSDVLGFLRTVQADNSVTSFLDVFMHKKVCSVNTADFLVCCR